MNESFRYTPRNYGILFLVMGAMMFMQSLSAQHKPATHRYYFDAAGGNDKNNGQSPSSAFRSFQALAGLHIQPGDSILLKSGAVFTDSLFFSGRGTAQKPIVIGKYGGRGRPYLKGDASHLEMVHLYNCEYIVIRDLEISNQGKRFRPHLSGLLVELYNYGIARNTRIENLYIHDVYGSLIKGEGNESPDAGGGQAIWVKNLNGGERDSIPSCYDGLLIQDCDIRDCQRNGIIVWGNWVRKYWFPNRRVVIRRNLLQGVPGDGIMPAGCDAPLVEYNVMQNCPDILPASEACDGIWPWSCDNAIIQYNIVSDHHSKVDGYGFDADYNCTNSLFQYNLSYHNDGGMYLLCNPGGWPPGYTTGNTGSVFRYNISIDDGIRTKITDSLKGAFSPVIHITGPTRNSRIEHNLLLVKKKKGPVADRRVVCSDDWQGYADSTFFTENIISVEEPGIFIDSTRSTNNFFDRNRYTGPLSTPARGFDKRTGPLQKEMYVDRGDPHWLKLAAFLKDKKIPMDGKKISVLGIIGWYTN